MTLYEQLLCDKYYLNTVKEIERMHFIDNGKWDWEHGLGHFTRVAEYVRTILSQLHSDERTIDLGMTSALLHDIGLSKGSKKGHAKESANMCVSYLENQDINDSEIELIRHAIWDHSKGECLKSLIDIALVLADKLDMTYHRTEHSTIQDDMNKQIQKIRKVDIDIQKDSLTVNYTTDDDFDVSILKNWDKSFLIPLKVALTLQKEYFFFINQETTTLESEIRRLQKCKI